MAEHQQPLLPAIKQKGFFKKPTSSINKTQKSKSKIKICDSQKWKRKLSLNSQNKFNFQKRCLSQKRFSLKRLETENQIQTLKLSQRNTDDNSENDKNFETFQEISKNNKIGYNITEKAVNMLQNMKEVDKVAKLYKKSSAKTKNSEKNEQSKRNLKSKYKCLVNPHVFERKPKHNNSDGTNDKKNKKQKIQNFDIDFWNKINESMILQSSMHQEPSKELFELMENILTQ